MRADDLLVLIESDWNLKLETMKKVTMEQYGINRIRLEFKVSFALSVRLFNSVLIESDWNLKL